MSDLPWEGEDVQRSYFQVIMSSGRRHVKPDPPIEGKTHVPKTDPDLLEWMGRNGFSDIAELPVAADYRDHGKQCGYRSCQECGVEVHHTAPRHVFGTGDAEDWPIVDLCPDHHREWHGRMEAWADAAALLATNEDDPVRRKPVQALAPSQRKRAEEVVGTLESIARNGRGNVNQSAKYLAFRLRRLLEKSKPADSSEAA